MREESINWIAALCTLGIIFALVAGTAGFVYIVASERTRDYVLGAGLIIAAIIDISLTVGVMAA